MFVFVIYGVDVHAMTLFSHPSFIFTFFFFQLDLSDGTKSELCSLAIGAIR